MKNLLSFVLALTLIFASCGIVFAEGNAQVFWYSMSDTYLSFVREALNEKLDAAGIAYVDQDANATQATQTDQITTAIATGTDLLCVNVVETGAEGIAQNIVDLAKNADIPLLFFNRSVAEEIVKSYDKSCFVGTNYEEAGIMQGNMIGDYLLADYEKYDLNGDGVISYVMFKGDEANQEAIARTKYGVENADAKLTEAGKPALKFYDDSNEQKYLVDQNGTWSRQVAQDYMQTILAQYTMDANNMIELVIANNDEMAIGAIQALQQAGYNNEGDSVIIPVFGVDATADAVNMISKGAMAGTIKQDAVGMADAIAVIAGNMIAGKADMFEGLDEKYIVEDGWKVVIPYAVYTGEAE